MTRQEIRERVLYLLAEDIESPAFYTEAVANDTIQEAMELIAEEIKSLRRQSIVVTRPGVQWYTTYEISPTCMTPIRIWSDGTGQRLEPTHMLQLQDYYSSWLTVTSDNPRWWYPISHDAFGIWPGPTEGGTVLRIDYLSWPETLYGDLDEPVFRDVEQDLIVRYGFYDGLIRQFEVERAMDVFQGFIAGYQDSRYKNEVKRFQWMQTNRTMHDRPETP